MSDDEKTDVTPEEETTKDVENTDLPEETVESLESESVAEAITEEVAEKEAEEDLPEATAEETLVEENVGETVKEAPVTEEASIPVESVESEAEETPVEEIIEATETPAMESAAPVEASEEVAPAASVETLPVAPVAKPKPKSLTKWYSLRVISGKERKIKERIDLEIDRSNWRGAVRQILVPTEKVYKIKSGKKVVHERNILPGYILVEAMPDMFSSEMVQAISNVPNVIHFLGRANPIPMRESEANRLLGKVDESNEIGESMVEPFIVGETIKIIDGPFAEFVGDIQEVNEEKKKLKVIVKIFGRGTEVELNFIQVEKQQ